MYVIRKVQQHLPELLSVMLFLTTALWSCTMNLHCEHALKNEDIETEQQYVHCVSESESVVRIHGVHHSNSQICWV